MEAKQTTALTGGARARRRRRLYAFLAATGFILVCICGGELGVSYHNSITPQGIIIHHSALGFTEERGRLIDVSLLDEIHRQRGFGIHYWGREYHIGYHYVILPDGTVQTGRPAHCQGAHALGYNSYLGIVLIGDFSTQDNPAGERGLQQPSEAQMHSLLALCRNLCEKYSIPRQNIRRHSDVNPNTECPGDRFPSAQFGESLVAQLEGLP